MGKNKENAKNITGGIVFSWIIATGLFIGGLGIIFSGDSFWGTGLAMVICAFFMTPYFEKIFSGKKKKFKLSTWAKVLLAPLLILFFSAFFGAFSNNLSDESQYKLGEEGIPTYKLGEKFTIDDFEYEFSSVKSSDYLGSSFYGIESNGVFLIFNIGIKNIGNRAEYINNEIYIIDSEGREFSQEDSAWIYLEDNFIFEQLNPSLSKRGQIVFDVPSDIYGKLCIKKNVYSSTCAAYVVW